MRSFVSCLFAVLFVVGCAKKPRDAVAPMETCSETVLAQASVPDGEVTYAPGDKNTVIIQVRQKIREGYHAYAETTIPLRSSWSAQLGPGCVWLMSDGQQNVLLRSIEDFNELMKMANLTNMLKMFVDEHDIGFQVLLPWTYRVQEDQPLGPSQFTAQTCDSPKRDAPPPTTDSRLHITSQKPGFTWYLSPLYVHSNDPDRIIEKIKDCIERVQVTRTPNPPITPEKK